MAAWFDETFGAEYGSIAMWSAAVLASLVLLLLVYLIMRRMFSGTFVAGGRGRKPRLAVLDAAAVDARRRLVLIRRDETEHLILIGGPTDVVIEQGIVHNWQSSEPEKLAAAESAKAPVKAARAPAPPKAERAQAAEPAPVPAPTIPERPRERQAEPAAARTIADSTPPAEPPVTRPVAKPPIPVAPLPSERTHIRAEADGETARRLERTGNYASAASPAAPQPAASAPSARPVETAAADRSDLDEALLRELEETLDRPRGGGTKSASLDEDMAEMIAEMARERV